RPRKVVCVKTIREIASPPEVTTIRHQEVQAVTDGRNERSSCVVDHDANEFQITVVAFRSTALTTWGRSLRISTSWTPRSLARLNNAPTLWPATRNPMRLDDPL